jgi:hypothetical protein
MRASAFCWPRSVLPAWGEPARPGFPPEGETGKGATPLLVPAGVPQQTRAALIPRFAWDFSAAEGCLNPLPPEHLKMVQRLFPMLDGIPFGAQVSQGQIQQLQRRFFTGK